MMIWGPLHRGLWGGEGAAVHRLQLNYSSRNNEQYSKGSHGLQLRSFSRAQRLKYQLPD